MATDFTDIYELNEIIKNDKRLATKTTNNIYKLYYKYLQYAIAFFQTDCYVDLTQNTPFQQQEYYFTANGTDNVFSLTPAPPSNCIFYVGESTTNDSLYTEITSDDYTYDSTAQTITTSGNILTAGITVYISGYIIGSFTNTLNVTEQAILSEGMLIPWDQEQLHKQSLLNQLMYGGNQKLYSQANHIDSVASVVNSQYYDVVKTMISDYTYRYSSDALKRLGGYNT